MHSLFWRYECSVAGLDSADFIRAFNSLFWRYECSVAVAGLDSADFICAFNSLFWRYECSVAGLSSADFVRAFFVLEVRVFSSVLGLDVISKRNQKAVGSAECWEAVSSSFDTSNLCMQSLIKTAEIGS